jgi:hypothetical protein
MTASSATAPRRPATLSHAKLSGLLIRIPCSRSALTTWLERRGPLQLAEPGDDAGDTYPVYCELWNVHDGALRVGTLDQHAFWELAGTAAGAMTGAAIGAWFSMFGGLERAAADSPHPGDRRPWSVPQTIAQGSATAARVVPSLARSMSRASANALGTYRESTVWIPNVVIRGRPERHGFVVGMLTDSGIARWADRAFGYGFDKQIGRFEVTAATDWTLWNGQSTPALAFRATPDRSRAREQIDLRELEAAVRSPILGVTRSGGLATSWLDRSFAAAPELRAISGTLRLSAELVPGSQERYRFASPGDETNWHVLQFSDVQAAVSYPRPVS